MPEDDQPRNALGELARLCDERGLEHFDSEAVACKSHIFVDVQGNAHECWETGAIGLINVTFAMTPEQAIDAKLVGDNVATRGRRHDAPDIVAHHLRTLAGDGSVEWVHQPIQASVLADAAELLDELCDLVNDMWHGMCGYSHDCRDCDNNCGTYQEPICEFRRRMDEVGVIVRA